MATISQNEFDKLVSHTIRVELKNGHTLIYYVSLEAKTAFYKLIQEDAISENENEFLWFYIPQDRLVLINKKDIIRITFCFDSPGDSEPQYHDNFHIITNTEEIVETNDNEKEDISGEDNSEEELYLPLLIIMHNRQMEKTEIVDGVTMETDGYFGNISTYSSLSEGDVLGFDFEYFNNEEEWILLTYKYLQFIDDDGEDNFMPLDNLCVIEVKRPLIMSDKILEQYLDRKPKKKTRTKRK